LYFYPLPIFNSNYYPTCFIGATCVYTEGKDGDFQRAVVTNNATMDILAPLKISDCYDIFAGAAETNSGRQEAVVPFTSGPHYFTISNSGNSDISIRIYGTYVASETDTYVII